MVSFIHIYLYTYIHIYITIGKKKRDYSFIPRGLFRDYSLIRGFYSTSKKSPDEWVITKQACKDESIVSLFSLSQYIALYFYISCIVKRKNQITDFLHTYIHTYTHAYMHTHTYIYISTEIDNWPSTHLVKSSAGMHTFSYAINTSNWAKPNILITFSLNNLWVALQLFWFHFSYDKWNRSRLSQKLSAHICLLIFIYI